MIVGPAWVDATARLSGKDLQYEFPLEALVISFKFRSGKSLFYPYVFFFVLATKTAISIFLLFGHFVVDPLFFYFCLFG